MAASGSTYLFYVAALRAQLLAAWLGAVVTTYNAEVLRRTGAAAPIPVDTADLKTLIAALSVADRAICPDGGAMHLAAALGKPVVVLFGDSPVKRWRPWGVPNRVVRPESKDLAELPLEPVLGAFRELQDLRSVR
jgi:ADP-heptose:LPS heptosyltransferase